MSTWPIVATNVFPMDWRIDDLTGRRQRISDAERKHRAKTKKMAKQSRKRNRA